MKPTRRSLQISALLLLLTTLFLCALGLGQQNPGIWEVRLGRNAQADSSITIRNQCQDTHAFTVNVQQMPFLQLLSAATINVAGHSSYECPVRFNTAGLNSGEYRGNVMVKCDDCAKEKTCKQDVEIIQLRLTIEETQTSPTPTPLPSTKPTPQPTPEATPTTPTEAGALASPSPSPCAPTATPTTYSVKDLLVLPTIDGSAPHCMATGVNEAGNVVGACLGKYAGGPPSGAWRAFRTDVGGAVIKKKDDLGFPAGAIGGVSFAMAVNTPGHVAGYWADTPTGGTDHKAFWYDGAKMINLHPPSFPLKVSEAYALNKSDDVVGTAWTLFSDKHAVIWTADAHVMLDLNDYMAVAAKKDWKLIEAYAINDAGEIVGRAKHLDKLHAFLLKGKGAIPIDLGALAEFKDDSSAGYSINACEQVVGYTFTPKAAYDGFLSTAGAGMKDMTNLAPAYPVSYAQAINANGEVAGVASKGFHHSAFFESIGFLIGSDPTGAAYAHAVWYNGSELKDLNKLIPGFSGWEIELANGINDKGQIAGLGFFKMPGYKSGSLISKAVLLTPAGVLGAEKSSVSSCPLSLPKGGYVFDNWNICGVLNGPTKDTTFTIDSSYLITFIATYHWNNGNGALPAKGISLKDSSGMVFGPWPVTTGAGSGGRANVNWECHPGVVLPAGTYTVVDPDPATWSQNAGSEQKGFVRVAGTPKK